MTKSIFPPAKATALDAAPLSEHTDHFRHQGIDAQGLPYLSPVDRFLQQGDHVLTLAARCLEAFCPLKEDALKSIDVRGEDLREGLLGHFWALNLTN